MLNLSGLFEAVPVEKELPDKEGVYTVYYTGIIHCKSSGNAKFENGKFMWGIGYNLEATGITHWLRPVTPERIEAFLREFGEKIGKYYWVEGFAEYPFDETAITGLINKTLGQ